MPVKLSLGSGAQTVAIELKDGVYRVGREKPADVVIPDTTISGNHAELQVKGAEWTIRDLGSTNGTFINDVPVRAAVRVRESDALRLGSVQMRLTSPAGPVQQAIPGASGPNAATVKMEAAKVAAGKLQWPVRYWIAGAEAILFLLILFFFIQFYASFNVAKQYGVIRYRMLASQYVHVLRNPVSVPAPLIDDSLADPFMVLDADGRVLYPANPDEQPKQSPVIDPKTKQIYQSAKFGLFPIPGSADENKVQLQSYPVRSGGDLLGYVVARPGKVTGPPIGFILLLLLLSGVVSLLLLAFALRPVHNIIRSAIESMRLKVSPLANGFVDELPRSENFAEANALAEEVEKSMKILRSGTGKVGGAAGAGRAGAEYVPIVAELFTASEIPYCFVDNDFKVKFMSNSFARVAEFNRAALGTSIFEAGLTSIQAKQLVQAIGDARRTGEATTQLSLNRDGNTENHNVIIRMMEHPQSRVPLTGLVFTPVAD
jgi:hypothetical protein